METGVRPRLLYASASIGVMAFLVVAAVAITTFVSNAREHIGADHLSFAGELVRAQQGGRELRRTTEHLVDHPSAAHQQQLLQTLWILNTRRESIKRYLERSHLDPDDYHHVEEEFASLEPQLARFEALVQRSLSNDQARTALEELAATIDNSQAFAYSELYQLVLEASAERQRRMTWLNRLIVALSLGVLVVVVGLIIAIVKIIGQRATMHQLSHTDDLTGLANRRALMQQAEQGMSLAARQHHPYSLALIDIDHFKLVNDRHGHPVGDRILQHVAATLTELIRQTDRLARVGGEEFCLLMPDTDAQGAKRLCERLRYGIATMVIPDQSANIQLTISIGTACCQSHSAAQFSRLYSEADQALYLAKREGRNRVEIAQWSGSLDT
ncbi:GGDEF domain-containing protein [Aidingimonas lacisalsi]|uniref:GGDEF domain-containing protein n=1 Tax=Aidingimonas lacisalsi TaxID=2604086 RepID=UPI001375CD3B|nr:GGDEF domain-containing protein [Aidingimonas lacisalsi]